MHCLAPPEDYPHNLPKEKQLARIIPETQNWVEKIFMFPVDKSNCKLRNVGLDFLHMCIVWGTSKTACTICQLCELAYLFQLLLPTGRRKMLLTYSSAALNTMIPWH